MEDIEEYEDMDNDNEDNAVQSDEPTEEDIKTEEPPKPKTLVELYGQRSVKLQEIKSKIANHSTAVISHPEINMNKLRDLLSMFDIKSDDEEYGLIFFSIQKMVALAALEVFKDIIPNYRVKEKINEEEDEKNSKRKNFQLKKQTKRLREFEKTLIQLYRLYLNRLQRMVDAISTSKGKKSVFYDQMLTSAKAKHRLAMIGLKCMSQLVLTHPHFNFRQQLIETIVEMMANNKLADLSDIGCETIAKVFRSDKLGEISLEAVKGVAKMVKHRNFKIQPKVLRTFLALKIREVKQKDELSKKDMKRLRVELNLMSRKERKRNKRMQKLDNQLLEVDAQESHKRRLAFNTEILNQVFVIYFRLLKNQVEYGFSDEAEDNKWFKPLLTPVLEGLSRFAHLIDIEFFDDLIALLYRLIGEKRLDSRQMFHCLQTVFTILSGEGQALNIDYHRFYTQLYGQLLFVDANTSAEDIDILIQCLHTMIVKRKKQMTVNRVLAFIKRLATVATQTDGHSSAALLAVIRQIMLNHRQSDILLDSEANIGSGVFMPSVEDPEHCNANSTLLWELTALTQHYDPIVRQMSEHLIKFSSNSESKASLFRREPLDLFRHLTSNNNNLNFFGAKHESPKKKQKLDFSLINSDSSLTKKCLNCIQNLE